MEVLFHELDQCFSAVDVPPAKRTVVGTFVDLMWEPGVDPDLWAARAESDPSVVYGDYPGPGRYVALWRVSGEIRAICVEEAETPQSRSPGMGVVGGVSEAFTLVREWLAGDRLTVQLVRGSFLG
jgi:hypothetical protein